MNITQSALTRQIQALEREIGVSLFERNKRNVKLSAPGVFLQEKWSILLNDLEYVHLFARKISLGETGHIRIAHPDSISSSLLPDLLAGIADSYPELTIELIQLLYEDIQESLQEYKIDLAITRQISVLPGISSQKIRSEHVALFVPELHPFMNHQDITAESLAAQKFILPVAERKSSYYYFVQEIFKFYNFTPLALYQSDFGSSMLGLVSKGLGIAILPASFIHHGTPAVRAIEIPFHTDLYISWRSDDRSPALLNAMRIITELCSKT
jgi:LysR family transcriptional activator of glutamate synthase operon